MALRGAVCDAVQEFALDSTDGCAGTAKETEQRHIAEEANIRLLFLPICFIFYLGQSQRLGISEVTLVQVLVGELGTWNSAYDCCKIAKWSFRRRDDLLMKFASAWRRSAIQQKTGFL